jgi:hypothetical protein
MGRQVSLKVSSVGEVTNKTKISIDTVPAYNIQAQGGTLFAKHFQGQAQGYTIYVSSYSVVKESSVFGIVFNTFNQAKFLPLEKEMIESFRFL